MMKHLLFIAVGGGLGAVSRYLLSKKVYSFFNIIFPVGTLFVNLTGSFLLGFLFYFFESVIVSNDVKSFLTIGFLGAYTTFSTYSLESFNLFRDGEIKLGLINILASTIIGIIMVILGMLSSHAVLKLFKKVLI